MLIAAAGPLSPAGAQAVLPPEVRQALEHNAAALSPISLTWERTRKSPLPLAQLLERLGPGEDEAFLLPFEMRFRWQDGKFSTYRTFRSVSKDNEVQVWHAESACDGEWFFSGTTTRADAGVPILRIESMERLQKSNPDERMFQADYFRDAGFHLPTTHDVYRDPPRSLIQHLLEDRGQLSGVREQDVEGTRFVLVELTYSATTLRFFLDPALGHAVRRREEWTRDGKRAVVVDNGDFVHFTKPEIWLPRQCHGVWYTWSALPGVYTAAVRDEPLVEVTITARELNKDPIGAEQFSLRYDVPGAVIVDGRLPGAQKTKEGMVTYRVPAEAADLDAAIAAAQEGEDFAPRGRSGRLLAIVLGGNGAILLAVVGYLLWRRRAVRRASAAGEGRP
jgi:hypothetical protein